MARFESINRVRGLRRRRLALRYCWCTFSPLACFEMFSSRGDLLRMVRVYAHWAGRYVSWNLGIEGTSQRHMDVLVLICFSKLLFEKLRWG